ncbi:MAG: hypothetical protein Q8O67_23320 [Deltaproteobacteria bacterium]|nr:hypothetical protein [Deltaproteobacteria bacterium]
MKTAREQLFEEVTALLAKPDGVDMGKLMARYRVQTKPGVEIAGSPTARDALGDRLGALIKLGTNDEPTRARIGTTIDEFRMQLKQAGAEKPAASSTSASPPRAPAPKPRAPLPGAPADRQPLPPPLARTASSGPSKKPAAPAGNSGPPAGHTGPTARGARANPNNVTLGVGEAPGRLPRSAEPVAGGPRARKKARGECPKCHSMGVVLARSYSGDEYYSCIYCGWQAYKPVDDDDPNASLALRLLGQTAGTE